MGLVTIDVSSFTNGNQVVIVEGITDSYYISGFIKLIDASIGVSIIPCAGVSQAPNIFSILLGWGVENPKVIVDDDSAGTKEYNKIKKHLLSNSGKESEKLLYKIAGCKGIEDIFEGDDFRGFATEYIDSSKKNSLNSELAKGNKEIIARSFLDRVNDSSRPLKLNDLNESTRTKITALVKFISK